MNYPLPLPTRIGKRVEFKPPKAVKGKGLRIGKVIDSIFSGPHRDDDWGHYLYVSDLIEWSDRPNHQRSIRLAYYYAPFESRKWIWGGQYSIEDSPAVINTLLQRTLGKAHWYSVPAEA